MPAPTVVGSGAGTVYSNPLSFTIGTDANFVIGGTGRSWTGTGTPALGGTYDGVAMTASATRLYAYNARASALLSLVNPATGARNYTRANGGTGTTVDRGAAIVSLKDVDTSSPLDTVVANSSEDGSTTPTVTISTDTNALAVAYLFLSSTATVTAGADETIVANYAEDGYRHVILTKAGAASVSFAPTLSASSVWSIHAVGVNGTTAGPTPSRITLSFRPPA
jgi:hypothetical protein